MDSYFVKGVAKALKHDVLIHNLFVILLNHEVLALLTLLQLHSLLLNF